MKFVSVDPDVPSLVEGYGLVKSCDIRNAKNGTQYLDIVLGDKDGEIYSKFWNYAEGKDFLPKVNTVIKVRGNLQDYNGVNQFVIKRMRDISMTDEVNMDDFIKSADCDGEVMYNTLLNLIKDFQDEELKNVVAGMLDDNKAQLITFPAAEKLHHAMKGGLLYHTLSIVRLAECVCALYPCIDRELLLSGAILHDIAKIREYSVNETSAVDGHTLEGMLLGHLVMGAEDVGRKCDELGIDSEKKYLLQHMLISHHGKLEFGAAVRPSFIEAEVLSQLDLFDANIYEMADAVKDVEKGGFTGRLWMLDNRKFYNHGRVDVQPQANLIEEG